MTLLPRIGALCAGLSGVLRLVAQAIPYVPDSPALELLYGTIDVCFLLAMVALLHVLAARVGGAVLGLLLAATAGVASIVGPDAHAFGIDFYLAGSALFTLALGAAALALVRLPGLRWPAAAWIVAALAGIGSALGSGSAMFVLAGLSLALGFVLIAPWLWRGGAAQA